MATQRGPKIVRNGLIFYVDGADRKSLSGSGATVWSELSGTSQNGTITAATFSSINGGALSFTAATQPQGVLFNYLIGPNSPRTVSLWAQRSSTADSAFMSTRADNATSTGFLINTSLTNLNAVHLGISPSATVTAPALNTWFNVVSTYDGTTLTIILNNSITNSVTVGYNTAIAAQGVLGNGSCVLNTPRPCKGLIANVSSYNRVLSTSELDQNFNTLRGRFGI